MPSFDTYKSILQGGSTLGQARKIQSDMVIEATWDGDIASQVGYFYMYDDDDHKTQLSLFKPDNDKYKVPIPVKVSKHTTQTFNKDQITYWMQFKPSQELDIPFYKERFADKYSAKFPVGLYVDLKDERGIYNRWMVVATAGYYDNQLPTWEVLPCTYIFDFVINAKKYRMAGVNRSQNSYNSGVWEDYKFETPQNQTIVLLPMNEITEHLWYNQRMIIDEKVNVSKGCEPVVWRITKVQRLAQHGICNLTFAQDIFDPFKDVIEYDKDGNVEAMYANLKVATNVDATDSTQPMFIHGVITHTGTTEVLKIGGNYKRFEINFFENDDPYPFINGNWSYTVDGKDASGLVDVTTTGLNANQIKVKFIGSDKYIGKVLKITYTTDDGLITTHCEMGIAGL